MQRKKSDAGKDNLIQENKTPGADRAFLFFHL